MSKPKLSVLVTRPESSGRELTKSLVAAGVNAIQQPLFQFIDGPDLAGLQCRYAQLPADSIIIFVSQPAFEFTDNALSNGWRTDLHYIAVGKKTAAMAASAGLKNLQHPLFQQNSEGVLALLDHMELVDRQVMIVRGNGGRELLHRRLSDKRANVQYCEAYNRQAVDINITNLYDQWRNHEINCIVITSVEHFIQLEKLMADYTADWRVKSIFVVFSQRIAEHISAAGCHQVVVCDEPSNAAVVSAISAISKSEDYV